MSRKVLIFDNAMEAGSAGAAEIVADIWAASTKHGIPVERITVRRTPERDIPKDLRPYTHFVLTGSMASPNENASWAEELRQTLRELVDAKRPLYGICFGHQILIRAITNESKFVGKAKVPEFGWTPVTTQKKSGLFKGMPTQFHSFMAHFEEVYDLPENFEALAWSRKCAIQAFQSTHAPIFGVQFHPERRAKRGDDYISTLKKKDLHHHFENPGRGNELYDEAIAITLMSNFLRTSA